MLLFRKFNISILSFIQTILTKWHVHANFNQLFINKQFLRLLLIIFVSNEILE